MSIHISQGLGLKRMRADNDGIVYMTAKPPRLTPIVNRKAEDLPTVVFHTPPAGLGPMAMTRIRAAAERVSQAELDLLTSNPPPETPGAWQTHNPVSGIVRQADPGRTVTTALEAAVIEALAAEGAWMRCQARTSAESVAYGAWRFAEGRAEGLRDALELLGERS